MDAKKVYHQLQELFPQVDPRILKAVSIEHPNDCDSAAEFIINEVLPTLGQASKLPTKFMRETNEELCYEGLLNAHREQNSSDKQVFETLQPKSTHQENGDLCDSVNKPVEIVNLEPDNCSSVYILEHMSTPVARTANSVTPSDGEMKFMEPIEIIDVEASKYGNHNPSSFSPIISEAEGKNMATVESNEIVTVEPTIFVSHDARGSGTAISEDSTNSSTLLLNAKGKTIIDIDACYHHTSSNRGENMAVGSTAPKKVNTISSGHENLPTCCNGTSSSYMHSSHSAMEKFLEFTTKYDNGASDGCEEHLVKPLANGSESSTTNDAAAEKALSSGHGKLPTCCNDTASSSYMHSSHSAMENFVESTMKYDNGPYDGCEEHLVQPLANESEPLTTNNDAAEKSLPKLLTSRSGHIINIDLLEDCVADAKSSKTDLVFAVESVTNMVKEAEFLEEKCMQAKHEASNAGEEILAKVDELKEMLQRAKQANDMHAGEIFGEKSVLLTEARELQSRLLNLADEKDKSLSLLEQMREFLETRLEAARNEISVAEKDKQEKEGFAVKALMEQEAIMESVVQEAKKLKEASEENAKLREFLDDRGRLVDTLEGEIAVICEDVMSLKRRVDNVDSLKSSRSSSSSDKSTALSSSGVLSEEQQSSSKKNGTFAFMQELDNLTNTNCSNEASAAASWHEKSLSDEDEWEILRNEVGHF